jgi:hypothetical protein
MREQVNFQWDDDEVRFVLDQHMLSWISIVLTETSPQVDMSLHLDTVGIKQQSLTHSCVIYLSIKFS